MVCSEKILQNLACTYIWCHACRIILFAVYLICYYNINNAANNNDYYLHLIFNLSYLSFVDLILVIVFSCRFTYIGKSKIKTFFTILYLIALSMAYYISGIATYAHYDINSVLSYGDGGNSNICDKMLELNNMCLPIFIWAIIETWGSTIMLILTPCCLCCHKDSMRDTPNYSSHQNSRDNQLNNKIVELTEQKYAKLTDKNHTVDINMEPDICQICNSSNLMDNKKIISLPCGDKFHEDCVNDKDLDRCPVCYGAISQV